MRVRVTGIQQFRDRHGKWRRYHRKSKTPMSMSLKGAALAAEVARLDALHKAKEAQPGTLRLLVIDYKTHSDHWAGLRARTRKDYERIFKWIGDDGLDTPIVDITAPDIAQLRDKAKAGHEYKFANQFLTTMKMVLQYGVEKGLAASNAASKVGRAQKPKAVFDADKNEDDDGANRPWAKEERDFILSSAPVHLLGPLAMGLYIGARQGDILRMSKKAVADGWVRFTASKNRKRIEAPIPDGLAAILDRLPTHDATTLLVNSKGKPWTSDGFRTSWGKWRDEMVALGHVQPGLTFHGTRHTVATVLAEDGWGDRDIGLALGQDSDAMPKHYSRRARHDERKMALRDSVQKANKSVKPSV
jgi:integrase